MADIDMDQWLEAWVETNIHGAGYPQAKAEMRDQAKACAEDAVRAGISIVELKGTADGDLETYLVGRQCAITDAAAGS